MTTHYSSALDSGALFASKRPILHSKAVRALDDDGTNSSLASSIDEDQTSINSSTPANDLEEEFTENECKYDDDGQWQQAGGSRALCAVCPACPTVGVLISY